MNAIEIKGLTKRYKSFTLEELNLTLPMGCVLGLVGENGAGKSTTLRLILDALDRDAGEVKVLGVDNRSREFLAVKEEVGVVLDETCVPEFITPLQLGKIMAGAYRNWDREAYRGWLERFELPEKKKFKEFSRGMSMKLGIAVALSHHAKLLLLDEATSGLDPMVREEVLEVFADFAQEEDPDRSPAGGRSPAGSLSLPEGHAVLLSSHIVSDLEKICDYIAFLHKGKLLLCEEKDVLLERYGLLKCGREDLKRVDPAALHGCRVGEFGAEALVERDRAPRELLVERCTLEDIILYLSKEAA